MEENKDLIDIKVIKREFINKILILGTLVFVVIITASILGILMAKAYNEKLLKEYFSIMEDVQEDEDNEDSTENTNYTIPVYSEEARYRMENIYQEGDTQKIAYLTFDDGPSSNITPQILQILKDEGIKATFFVLGSRVELYPELVKQEYEEGHYIANHGYSHDYTLVYASANAVLDEYNRTEALIKKAIGNEEYSSYLFRFPGGSSGGKYADIKKEAKELLKENNIEYINWNALTNDAVGSPTAESIINDLKSTASGKDKIVILMHDSGSKQLTVDTLPEIIAYLKNEGYEFKNFYDIMY